MNGIDGFNGFSMEFSMGFSMGFNGIFNGFQWVLMGFNGFNGLSWPGIIDFHGIFFGD